MKFHPLAESYPLMPDHELQLLIEDMRAHGYDARFPIVIHEDAILDGRNRQRAADKAGVVHVPEVDLPQDVDPVMFVRRANEHRRHLDQAWLQKRREERVKRVAAGTREGKSLRVIAEEEKISEKQVREDLKKSGAEGSAPAPPDGKVTGKDGKKQAAKKKAFGSGADPSAPERQAGEDDTEEAHAPTDRNGKQLPLQAVAAFRQAGELTAACRAVDELVRETERLGKSPVGAHLHYQSVQTHLKNAKNGLVAAKPAVVCPYCQGQRKGCKVCRGHGWVTSGKAKNAPAN